jgi:hypothetical protein
MVIKSSSFLDIRPYSPLKTNRRFEGTYLLHLHGLSVSQVRNQHGAGVKQRFLLGLLFSREQRRQVPPKRYLTFNWVHGIISQKSDRFIFTKICKLTILNDTNISYFHITSHSTVKQMVLWRETELFIST